MLFETMVCLFFRFFFLSWKNNLAFRCFNDFAIQTVRTLLFQAGGMVLKVFLSPFLLINNTSTLLFHQSKHLITNVFEIRYFLLSYFSAGVSSRNSALTSTVSTKAHNNKKHKIWSISNFPFIFLFFVASLQFRRGLFRMKKICVFHLSL